MDRIFGRKPLPEAIRALQAELDGGPQAQLPTELDTLARLVAEREARVHLAEKQPPEQELLAALPEAAAMVGKDGRVRFCNLLFDALAPSGRAAGLTLLEITRNVELADAVKRGLEGSARLVDVNYQRRTFVAHVAPLLRGEVLLLLRDVTERKRGEAARRDFVANASHELRTPVAAIAGAAETLLSGALDHPAEARSFVEVISRHADRLAHLSRDLLDLSRIESGQWNIDLVPVRVAIVSQAVIDLSARDAQEKRITIRQEVPTDLTVRADARALEQVLVNLLDNAIKYTPAGGRAMIEGRTEGNEAIISVVDTGPGIERHHLSRLFERFYRVDAGRSRDAGGTGLGLAIVKHLIQAQSGEVGVESGADGSRFWIRLPRAET